jgi:hypothetical protein
LNPPSGAGHRVLGLEHERNTCTSPTTPRLGSFMTDGDDGAAAAEDQA